MFKPQNWLDRAFEIGIIGKGINGAAELIGGTLLLFLTPDKIHHLVAAVTLGELSLRTRMISLPPTSSTPPLA